MQLPSCRASAARLIAMAWLCSTACAAPVAPRLHEAVDQARRAGFAGVVAVLDAHDRIDEIAVGDADREARRPHRAGQRWLWASVTKQVTAALVMQQVDAARLSLDDRLADRLPAFGGATRDRITVRQLLQHTSGLPNPDDGPAGADDIPDFHRERGAAIADARRATGYCAGPPKAEPGAGFSYDNCDYLVLGAILERATGRRYADLVKDRIARAIPTSTLAPAPDGANGTDVVGYLDATHRHPPVNVATFGAAGALVGTPRDLLAFDRLLMSHRLVSEPSTAVMWTGDPKLGDEALGAWSFPARLKGCDGTVHLVERRGDVAGIQVRNVIAPRLGRALVIFTNDASVDFGEVWQGRGLTFDLLSAAFCDGGT